jgi:methionine sulfoxide reductase heme-binding subunit
VSALASTLGPSAYWYVTRSTGAVALVLLTVSVVLGVMGSVRFSAGPRWPRFAIDALHRDVSLLVIVLVVVHVVTTVLDGFAPITLLDGLIPFRSPYRPLWLGLGAVSFDLLIALVITSLARRRLGYRSWRAIHWLAYASWPVAVLHGLGTGSDVKSWWMLTLTVLCLAAVLAAVLIRIGRGASAIPALRTGTTMLAVATPIGMAAFAFVGPLQKGWARRAGTPLPKARTFVISRRPTTTSRAATKAPSKGPLDRPFSAALTGTVAQTTVSGGAIVELSLRLTGNVAGQMRIRLGGSPLPEGGLSLTGSQVDLTAPGMPSALAGKVLSLNGDVIVARVSDVSGNVVRLEINLSIDQSSGAVTGRITGQPIGGTR